jgi:ABC-type multidrug transport system ATPase subunit
VRANLHVEQLTIVRGRRRVVDKVSFTLQPGEILAVVGANGAGKTTLLEGLLGFLPRAAGAVRWENVALESLPARARVFSFLPDAAEPPPEVTISTLLEHARRFGHPSATLDARLQQGLGLTSLKEARAGELSRGEKRRLQLYLALCCDRPVVVLDEPLGTFDPLQLIGVLELLRERAASGTALLLSVHQMPDAEKIASRILILDQGRPLGLGTLDQLRAQAASPGGSLESVFLALLRSQHAGA